ncbi:unnamed protein product, partial [Choristocarpus tenellus]
LIDSYSPNAASPVFNPQGYVFTLAGGSGSAGFADGVGEDALFQDPQDVAVDVEGNVYVADTGNHRIRMVTPKGVVSTIAGDGTVGHDDGTALEASFSSPTGVAVYYDEDETLVIFVADKNNHRIRRIYGNISDASGTVECYAGRCGNGTETATLEGKEASPEAGFADGDGDIARFDGPTGLVAADDGTLFVADTNNHIIRIVLQNRTVGTLAGELKPAEIVAGISTPGCQPPCLEGVAGHRDGNLTHARFNYPSDVAIGVNSTLLVSELHSIRRVAMPESPPHTLIQGIGHEGRVTTVVGGASPGMNDGTGDYAQLSRPSGVATTSDGMIYVAESASCRLRRVAPSSLVAANATCLSRFVEALRPSGCGSYDPPVGGRGKTATSLFGNIFYNRAYGSNGTRAPGRTGDDDAGFNSEGWGGKDNQAGASPDDAAWESVGREVKDCVGTPPVTLLDKENLNGSGLNLVVDDGLTSIKEDTGDGTEVRLSCPVGCLSATTAAGSGNIVWGGGGGGGLRFYSDESAVCLAALHAGVLGTGDDGLGEGGVVTALLRPGTLAAGDNDTDRAGSTSNGVTSGDVPYRWPRVFTFISRARNADGVSNSSSIAEVLAQTIAGRPMGPLGEGCGPVTDGQPPQEAVFDRPFGMDAWRPGNLTDNTYLYVADSGNHAIRAVSAVCSFVCENNGTCVGSDKCACSGGWVGHDCSLPTCSDGLCGSREICVGPEECACIPGYSGSDCNQPQCVQECQNEGSCWAPDTCSCSTGWFGPNCTVPVCAQTCGNGGNCTSPGSCSCPAWWSGGDCRTPVCRQECLNGGMCVAPDTCSCPPQWSGHDCAMPVCTQGFFLPGFNDSGGTSDTHPLHWQQFVPCDIDVWCNSTNGFHCSQPYWSSEATAIAWESSRNITGFSEEPNRCMMLELSENVISPFTYLIADNSSTRFARYSPLHPYEWIAYPSHPWSAYNDTVEGRTLPWEWAYDRQVALAEYHNVTEGRYVCANGGNCTSPGVCQCSKGWAGFDCRTPICTQVIHSCKKEKGLVERDLDQRCSFAPLSLPPLLSHKHKLDPQGYYEKDQVDFVAGFGRADDSKVFLNFMGNTTQPLNWPYSNPNHTEMWEEYVNETFVRWYNKTEGNNRYLTLTGQQGGYYCSIRSYTKWENEFTVLNHPNYWSRYMDTKARTETMGVEKDNNIYTHWEWMRWPPVHNKSEELELTDSKGNFFIYTDRGYMQDGDWHTTGNAWQKGVCLIEFNRTCPQDEGKAVDLESLSADVLVQDTDLSFRTRATYTIWKEIAEGRWEV